MKCQECGEIMNDSDIFCRSCGAPKPASMPESAKEIVKSTEETAVAADAVSVDTSVVTTYQKELKARKRVLISIVIVVILLVAYFGARFYMLGPTSPSALQKEFIEALNTKDTEKLSKLLDPNQKQLSNPQTLAAFKNSLTQEVIHKYTQTLQTSALAAEEERERNGNNQVTMYGSSWIKFLKTSSFLGSSWNVHITPILVKVSDVPNTNTKVKLQEFHGSKGELGILWPSIYEYKVTGSNTYATVSYQEHADLISELAAGNNQTDTYEIDPALLYKQLTVHLPEAGAVYSSSDITLNGKPIAEKSGTVVIMPAPEKAEFHIKANVSGQNIERKFAINPLKDSQVYISDIMNEASEQVMKTQNTVYNTMDEFVRIRISAINYGDFSYIEHFLVPGTKLYNIQKEIVDTYLPRGIGEELVSYSINSVKAIDNNTYEADVNETLRYLYQDGTSELKKFHFIYTIKYDGTKAILTERVDTK